MQELSKGKKKALIWTVSILAGVVLCGGIGNAVAKRQIRLAMANIPGLPIWSRA